MLGESPRHHPLLLHHLSEVGLESINIDEIRTLIRVLLCKEHYIVQVHLTALLRLKVSDHTCEILDLNMIRRLQAGPLGHFPCEEQVIAIKQAGNALQNLIVNVSQGLLCCDFGQETVQGTDVQGLRADGIEEFEQLLNLRVFPLS